MSKNDGGPAFPSAGGMAEIVSRMSQSDNGMSLRDYFAAAALTGLCAAIPGPGCASWDYYSEGAFAIADAMLAERSKTEGTP